MIVPLKVKADDLQKCPELKDLAGRDKNQIVVWGVDSVKQYNECVAKQEALAGAIAEHNKKAKTP